MIRYLGYFAGLLTVVSFLPQVLRAWRTKEVEDLSMRTCILLVVSSVVWIIYGVGGTDWPVILTNSGLLVLNIAVLVAKLRFGGTGSAPPQGSGATPRGRPVARRR